MKRCLLFIGGEGPGPGRIRHLLAPGVFLVAADSGLDLMESMGLRPHLVLGDMDSVSQGALTRLGDVPLERHPAAKALTDTELGLEAAWSRGYDDVILVGGGGGRLDHILALQRLFLRATSPTRWYTQHDEVLLIQSKARLVLRPGEQCSFFPLATPCSAATRGLRWNLDGLCWEKGDFGISNEALSAEVTVELHSGSMIFVRRIESSETPGMGEY